MVVVIHNSHDEPLGLVQVAPAPHASKLTEALPVVVTRLHRPPKTAQLRTDLKSRSTAAVMPRWSAWAAALAC
jgi:hypothetical protein